MGYKKEYFAADIIFLFKDYILDIVRQEVKDYGVVVSSYPYFITYLRAIVYGTDKTRKEKLLFELYEIVGDIKVHQKDVGKIWSDFCESVKVGDLPH